MPRKCRTLRATVGANGVRAVTDAGDIHMSGTRPSPVDHLLASLAGCAGLTLRSILEKRRADVGEITGQLRAEYQSDPYRLEAIRVHFAVRAEGLSPAALDKTLAMLGKYCPVHGALSPDIDVTYTGELL